MQQALPYDAESLIRGYYATVDRSTAIEDGMFRTDSTAIDSIMELFADDAVYERAQKDQKAVSYERKENIRHFFAVERPLVGTHAITSLEVNAEKKEVVVRGVFEGKYCSKMPEENGKVRIRSSRDVKLDFVDTWRMHDGKVVHRRSDITPQTHIAPQDSVRYRA